ncbi:MAG: restriction endonuclease subunit S [Acidobacteriia bacterium]|nr:restriction endonuclease subunit S [Terriglobia bacterium]
MTEPTQKNTPPGWIMATLGILCEKPQYGWTTSATVEGTGAKLLRSTDISRGTVDWDTVPFCESLPPVIEKYQLHSGDIVITRTGAGVGNSLLLEDCPLAVFASYLIRFRPHAAVSAKYVACFLKSPSYKSLVSLKSAGIAQPNVNANKLALLEIPVAPRKTQDAIVAEIERQFTRLDAAVAALKRVQANLKRYRAAVLKAACEGRLVPTEAELARREGRSYEPASVLLERILAERRSRWEANELSKLKSSGKAPKDFRWKEKYKVPGSPASGNAPAVPEGWAVGSLEQLTSAVRVICYGILMPKEDMPDGVPYVRVLDLRGDRIDMESLKRTSPAIAQVYARASLKGGDVLLAIRGSYGRVAEVPFALEGGNITQDTARLEVSELVDHRYIATCLRSPIAQSYFERVARGVAVKGVNIADVRLCPIPIPSYPEQGRIVVEVERRLSIIDELVTQIDADLKRAARLRQSILKNAFGGRLVPQDPKDEPASMLLERIRAERDANSRSVRSKKQAGEVVVL